ncbi:MAG: diadenylate cyclase CdaA [Planctomycetes bacterium]|nr:diadenylate cyclase CdaA [Planctomycetota bacterium]
MSEIIARVINALPAPEALIEIPLIALVVYLVLRTLHGTRGEGVFKGLVFALTIAAIAVSLLISKLKLEQMSFLLRGFLTTPVLALVILFQPELRRGLVRLGKTRFLRTLLKGEESALEQVAEAAMQLSKMKIGALIAFQRDVGLEDFIEGGTRLDADVTSELLMTIFWPDTPLSDGGVVIQNLRVAAAGCIFPLSESPHIDRRLGTRHRAAIGLTEDSDAVALIVSEETGIISLSVGGQIIRSLNKEQLFGRLRHLISIEKPEKTRKG